MVDKDNRVIMLSSFESQKFSEDTMGMALLCFMMTQMAGIAGAAGFTSKITSSLTSLVPGLGQLSS